ncbi:MAG: single-stranded-DNA-specific exonuclease RecJ [Clostridia bacterium]|nr:single-stranded-DNA-specific exonuclease RecJ [Clostridia bacterium]
MLLYERTKKYAFEKENVRYPKGISPLLASLLYARGAKTEDEMQAFLHPSLSNLCDPFLLHEMDKAKARIERAIENREHILVYGDYDVDGMCAAAILVTALRENGADVSYFIPTRKDDGYGMSESTVKTVANMGAKLIITVDNGVKSIDEIALAYSLGMDVVVTDHHMCGDELPKCEAVVCHTVKDNIYPNEDICGAGTALKLVHALFGFEKMKKHIPLAGIATIADVVKLTGENRVIVSFALKMIANGECPLGVSILLEKAVGKKEEYTTSDISFGFAPRLNAAGRMESAVMGVELLCSESESETEEIAEKLNKLNASRQDEEAKICTDVIDIIEKTDLSDAYSVILKSEKWHQGVIGIAASRIAEKYYRPAILFSEHDGVVTGSARSIPDVDIYNALERVKTHFSRFGGHAYAAGITLVDNCDMDALQKELDNVFLEQNDKDMFIPRKFYEVEMNIEDVTESVVREINMLAPFGMANPSPVFCSKGVTVSKVKRVGKDASHLSMLVHGKKTTVKAIAFSMGDRFDEVIDSERLDILYSPSVDTFSGRSFMQIKISALKKCDALNTQKYFDAHDNDFRLALVQNFCKNFGAVNFEKQSTDEIFDKIKEKAWGTLVLCFTKRGAVRFEKELVKRGLYDRVDTCFFKNRETPCPYNLAVYAPVADRLSISRYQNIIVYDQAPFDGVLHEILNRTKAEKIIVNTAFEDWKSDIKHMAGSIFKGRDGITPYYRGARDAGPEFYNENEAVRKLLDRVENSDEALCRFALTVCEELGFLKKTQNGGIQVVKAPEKKELEESVTYLALKGLAE